MRVPIHLIVEGFKKIDTIIRAKVFCNFRISFNSNSFLQDAHVITKELRPVTKPRENCAHARVAGPETDVNLRNLRVSYK